MAAFDINFADDADALIDIESAISGGITFHDGAHLFSAPFYARKVGAQVVRVEFPITLRNKASTTVTTNYTFVGPSTLTTASVAFTPGDSFVELTVTGAFAVGTYILSMAAQTVESAVDEGVYNFGTATINIPLIGVRDSFATGFN